MGHLHHPAARRRGGTGCSEEGAAGARANADHGGFRGRRGDSRQVYPVRPEAGLAAGPHHHYTFELFALDTKLDLGPEATRADVLQAIDGHILGKGVLVGRFHR